MILIGENLHIISKTVRTALENRDETFVLDLINKQKSMDYVDLNVGPAKKALESVLPWLCKLVEDNSDLKISFDTTNYDEMRRGIQVYTKPENAILNSTSADIERLDKLTDLAAEFGSGIVGLTLNKEIGIPSTSDGRLELAFEIYEKCAEKGIDNSKIFFDPLILPITVNQTQAMEAINTIQMIKESFDPPVMTTIGLSNVSNGSPKELRGLINRVFAVLAFGAGLDSAIIDATDFELVNTLRMLADDSPKTSIDNLYISLASMIREFSELEDVKFDKTNPEELNVIKCARILLNKEIYSHSFTQA